MDFLLNRQRIYHAHLHEGTVLVGVFRSATPSKWCRGIAILGRASRFSGLLLAGERLKISPPRHPSFSPFPEKGL